MVPDLSPAEFPAFFRAVHDGKRELFPWQARLAEQVFETGCWPERLSAPTGAGKTAVLEIAVFHLALEAARGAERKAPLRIAFVVDRRLVVDAAHGAAEHLADRLAGALATSESTILRRVAERLRLLAGPEEPPLTTARLRGGMPKEPDWVRTPCQPVIVSSTVDQVGSRLFFRGYGISESMRPVHAGLLGTDSLLFLDEAHLSEPFLQSLRDSRRFQAEGPWSEDATASPFQVVPLSATHGQVAKSFLQDDDLANEVLGPRLAASKPVALELVKEAPDRKDFAERFVDAAWSLSLLGGGSARVTAVVVNRVGRARDIHDALERRIRQGKSEGDAMLLIGRARALARDALKGELLRRTALGRETTEGPPLIVVATQCIEAGADLDFDAMVSEIAPLDCLRQRFGRLNRAGRSIETRARLLAARSQVKGRKTTDPLYGDAPAATWTVLSERAERQGRGKTARQVIDFGTEASGAWWPDGDLLDRCHAPTGRAPVMLPAFVEQWSRTRPSPAVEPEVALFLHGPRSGPEDVQVAWRVELEAEREDEWLSRVNACPPSVLETLSLPIGAVRSWLRRVRPSGELWDSERAPERPEERSVRSGRKALRWKGGSGEEASKVSPEAIRPGDTIVVPAGYGGCDRWGWSPGASDAVEDLAEHAVRQQRLREVLRLSPGLMVRDLREEGVPQQACDEAAERLRGWLVHLANVTDSAVSAELAERSELPARWRGWLEGGGSLRVRRDPNGRPLVLERPAQASNSGEPTGAPATEDEEGQEAPQPIPLASHSGGVESLAHGFARTLSLPVEIQDDVALAAYLHDAGKAHPAYQVWLHGGDEIAAALSEPIAKSSRLRLGWKARKRARLPSGARHELASLAFAQAHPRFARANDPDLVLWLIGTHHGHGRPLFPSVKSSLDWPEPGSTFQVDLGDGAVVARPAPSASEWLGRWSGIRSRLTRRHGPWGLARLEAVLRLADHRRSEAERKGEA